MCGQCSLCGLFALVSFVHDSNGGARFCLFFVLALLFVKKVIHYYMLRKYIHVVDFLLIYFSGLLFC